jgi:hypothetical protein
MFSGVVVAIEKMAIILIDKFIPLPIEESVYLPGIGRITPQAICSNKFLPVTISDANAIVSE